MIIDVVECARCGEDHKKLNFTEFAREPIDVGHATYTHWATCPATQDPILLKTVRVS